MLHLAKLSELAFDLLVQVGRGTVLIRPQPPDIQRPRRLRKAAGSTHVVLVGCVPLPPKAVVQLVEHAIVNGRGDSVKPSAIHPSGTLSAAELDAKVTGRGTVLVGLRPARVGAHDTAILSWLLAPVRRVPVLPGVLVVPNVVVLVPLQSRVASFYVLLLLPRRPLQVTLVLVGVHLAGLRPSLPPTEPASCMRGWAHFLGSVPSRLHTGYVVVVHLLRRIIKHLSPVVTNPLPIISSGHKVTNNLTLNHVRCLGTSI